MTNNGQAVAFPDFSGRGWRMVIASIAANQTSTASQGTVNFRDISTVDEKIPDQFILYKWYRLLTGRYSPLSQ